MNSYNRNFQPWNARTHSRTDTAYQLMRQGQNSRSPMGWQRVSNTGDRVECNNSWWKNVGLGRKPTTCS